MGLPRAAVNLLLDVAGKQPFAGRVATLGRQHVYVKPKELASMAERAGVSLPPVATGLHANAELRARGYISDDSLFNRLGFQEVVRIDHSDYEGAEEAMDLNFEETPQHLYQAFDTVLDSGTIEHVFNIGQSLKHCLNMTRDGGRIIHLTPSSNAVNHGFYSVSPTLFADFYTASGCQIECLWLCNIVGSLERGRWNVYDCMSNPRNWLPIGRLNKGAWLTFAVIRKMPDAVPAIPQQSFYLTTWDAGDKPTDKMKQLDEIPSGPGDSKTESRAERLLRLTSGWPRLRAAADWLIKRWRQVVNAFRERRGRVPYDYVGRF